MTVNNIALDIKNKCSKINQFFNHTNDGFYFIILNQYFNNEQYLPWYLDENYYNSLMNHFNKDFNIKLKKNLIDENIFIIIESNALFLFKKI